MYLDYWGFKDKPFENTVNTKYIYYSLYHREAITRVYYVIKEKKGLGMLSGDYGCGKTLVVRFIFEKLVGDNSYKVIFIPNPSLNEEEILEEILFQLSDHKYDKIYSKLETLRLLQRCLEELNLHNIHPVIIIDEAQAVRKLEVFDELRLLTNYQGGGGFLFSLIFSGQPELIEKINSMEQLKQRISMVYHLSPLDYSDIEKYILHRCKVAGCERNIFEDNVFPLVYKYSGGIPRKINLICDLSLLAGMSMKKNIIDVDVVNEVVEEIDKC